MVDDLISLFRPVGGLKQNVVIKDPSGTRLATLCKEFAKRKQDGEPLVYCDKYDIKDNDRRAVSGGDYRPSICWVYLDRVSGWIEQLDGAKGAKTKALKEGSGDFDNFPHYRTFGEKSALLIDLNRERVHALTNLTAWSVLTSKDYLADKLHGASLPTDQASAD